MTVRELLALLLRRRYVVVAGLLATLGLVLGTTAFVQPVYESRATVVLLPGAASITEGGNPLLFLGGLNQARDVLVRKMQSDEVLGRLLEESASDEFTRDDFTVEPDALTSGPSIIVTGRGFVPAAATQARDGVVDLLPRELARLQDEVDAPADTRISSLVLTSDEEPALNSRGTTRAMVATVVVGVSLTLFSAALIDSILLSRAGPTGRRSRRGSRQQEREAAAAVEATSGEVRQTKGGDRLRTEAEEHGTTATRFASRTDEPNEVVTRREPTEDTVAYKNKGSFAVDRAPG